MQICQNIYTAFYLFSPTKRIWLLKFFMPDCCFITMLQLLNSQPRNKLGQSLFVRQDLQSNTFLCSLSGSVFGAPKGGSEKERNERIF